MFGWFKSTPKPKPVLYRYSQEFTLTTVNDEIITTTISLSDRRIAEDWIFRVYKHEVTDEGLRIIKEKGIKGVWYPMSQIKSITYGEVIKKEIG